MAQVRGVCPPHDLRATYTLMVDLTRLIQSAGHHHAADTDIKQLDA